MDATGVTPLYSESPPLDPKYIRRLIDEANNAYDFSRWMDAFNLYKKIEFLVTSTSLSSPVDPVLSGVAGGVSGSNSLSTCLSWILPCTNSPSGSTATGSVHATSEPPSPLNLCTQDPPYCTPSSTINIGHVFYRLAMMHQVGYYTIENASLAKPYFEKAFAQLLIKAEEGDPEAQADLGYMYYNGHTDKGIDIEMALEYYQKAGEQGYSRALCNLGYIYYNSMGYGKPSDKKLALEYYKKAAYNGSLVAHSNLGFIYKDNSDGIPQNYLLAFHHFFAASKGNEKARSHLATVFSGECNDEEYRRVGLEYLGNVWPAEHSVLHPACQLAIMEVFYLTLPGIYYKSEDAIANQGRRGLLPELATLIIRYVIRAWPQKHFSHIQS